MVLQRARRVHLGLRHTVRRRHSNLTFRPSRAPESRGTLPSFMRLLSKMRPIRRSPSLDGCHVTGCYKVRATTHLLFNDSSTWIWLKQTTVHSERGKGGGQEESIFSLRGESSHKLLLTHQDCFLYLTATCSVLSILTYRMWNYGSWSWSKSIDEKYRWTRERSAIFRELVWTCQRECGVNFMQCPMQSKAGSPNTRNQLFKVQQEDRSLTPVLRCVQKYNHHQVEGWGKSRQRKRRGGERSRYTRTSEVDYEVPVQYWEGWNADSTE